MSREEFLHTVRRVAERHPRSRETDFWGMACRSTGIADLSYAMTYEDEKVMICSAISSEALFVYMKKPAYRPVAVVDGDRVVKLQEDFGTLAAHLAILGSECGLRVAA